MFQFAAQLAPGLLTAQNCVIALGFIMAHGGSIRICVIGWRPLNISLFDGAGGEEWPIAFACYLGRLRMKTICFICVASLLGLPSCSEQNPLVATTLNERASLAGGYQRFEGSPLKKVSSQQGRTPDERAAYLLSQRAAVMP